MFVEVVNTVPKERFVVLICADVFHTDAPMGRFAIVSTCLEPILYVFQEFLCAKEVSSVLIYR